MQRRQFIKAGLGSSLLWPLAGISGLAWGAADNAPMLLSVFLRGGADGLQMVGPSTDPDYVTDRPPELRVLDSGERAGISLANPLDRNLDFRFHAEARPLAELYQAGRLGIVHAVGLQDGTRSHFVAQDMIERGIADERDMKIESGWLGRALKNAPGRLAAYSATAANVQALQGLTASLSLPDLSAGAGLPWGDATSAFLRAVSGGTGSVELASAHALDVLDAINQVLPRDGNGKVLAYKPAGKASYDGAGDLARSLSSVARLARADIGLRAACIDFGGWDTHEGQAGRFANQVRQLSLGLAAFHEDMSQAGKRCIVVVMSEFGRRLRANRSGGTDHGHGCCWLVLGDGVQGGRMFGRWPGLATEQLDRGVDLAVTTDYRQVLGEVLAAQGHADLAGAFPGWRSGGPLGLFA